MKRFLIDASLYKEHNCMRKVYNILVQGWRYAKLDYKMEYGTAGHKFLANWHSGGSYADSLMLAINHYTNPAIEIPPTDWRTAGNLMATLQGYTKKYPFQSDAIRLFRDKDNKPVTEARFQYPFRVFEKAGIEIVLCGTIDAPSIYMGEVTLVDHKFTALWKIKEFLAGYEQNCQLKMYKYISSKLAALFPDTFGMFSNPYGLINGVFIKKDGASYERSQPIMYSDAVMEEFESNLNRFIENFVNMMVLYQGKPLPRNDTMCDASPFGRCKFWHGCVAEDEETEAMYLERDFVKSEYDPMKFGEGFVEDGV